MRGYSFRYATESSKMKISILTASFNYARFIGATIESVLAQTYRDWELIVVDDGSTDSSVEVVRGYLGDKRIRLLTHEGNRNRGLPATLRLGLSECTGEYTAFLESDDLWTPDCLEKRVKILEQFPDVALIANDVELFGDPERIKSYNGYFGLRDRCFSGKKFPCNLFGDLLKENFIPTFSSAMGKTDVLRGCKFDVEYPPWLDRYLWLQIAYRGKFYYTGEKLTRWRIHATSYIGKEADAYKTGNNRKIRSLVECVFSHEPNWLVRRIKTEYYYLAALRHKYARAVRRRSKALVSIDG